MAFELPPLPYPFDALEPHIDARTMEIHHDRHHGTYVTNLNNALAKHPELANTTNIEQLLSQLHTVPEDIRTAVRNNGGGHLNHSMFWTIMTPNGGGEPTGALADAIKSSFGDFAAFKNQFQQAGLNRFGSGWAWLIADGNRLTIESTANQDNPIMEGKHAVMGVDVWEHAYYLKYQNKRADYLTAWWNTLNWPEISRRFESMRR